MLAKEFIQKYQIQVLRVATKAQPIQDILDSNPKGILNNSKEHMLFNLCGVTLPRIYTTWYLSLPCPFAQYLKVIELDFFFGLQSGYKEDHTELRKAIASFSNSPTKARLEMEKACQVIATAIISFPTSQRANREQVLESLVECIASDVNSPESYRSFCSEFGYQKDDNSRKIFDTIDATREKIIGFIGHQGLRDWSEVREQDFEG